MQPPRDLVEPVEVLVALFIIVVVKAAGERRGPYEEARLLYDDATPPRERLTKFEQATREPGAGRPEKKERRQMERLKGRFDFED